MRRLLPSPIVPITSVRDQYDVDRTVHTDGRPWIGVCMVASLDGSIAVDGRSGALSSPHDTEVLLSLRQLADVIVVGAGTVRDEGYGPPATPGQRVGVVTNSGRLDFSTPLFTSGAGFLICPEALGDVPVETLRAGTDRVEILDAMRRLPEVVPGVVHVQVEGGAQLNATLADLDLIDELALTMSPMIVGGDGARLTTGADGSLRSRYELAHLLVDDESFIFTRWVRRRAC